MAANPFGAHQAGPKWPAARPVHHCDRARRGLQIVAGILPYPRRSPKIRVIPATWIFAPLRHTDKVDDGKPGEEGEPAHTRCHVGNGGTSALQQKHVAAGIVRRVRASTGSICEIHSVQSENGG
jgi:hypothetical protein